MSLEFACSQCGKTLRTLDDSAGKAARCPTCQAITPVPAAPQTRPSTAGHIFPGRIQPVAKSEAAGGDSPRGFGGGNPFAEVGANLGAGPGATATDLSNPYAASSLGSFAVGETVEGERTGPPWERDGYSWRSFWETVKLVLGNCEQCFRGLRRGGGYAAPAGFALAGNYFGGAISLVWQLLFGAAGQFFGGNQGAPFDVTWPLVEFFLLPLGVLVGLTVGTAITHGCVTLLGGNKAGFEGTFRVVAYVQGATAVLTAIPMFGTWFGLIAALVCEIIGLAQIHEISGGKAAAAVLLPMVLCCGALAGLGVGWLVVAGGQF